MQLQLVWINGRGLIVKDNIIPVPQRIMIDIGTVFAVQIIITSSALQDVRAIGTDNILIVASRRRHFG